MMAAARLPARSDPTNNQFDRPTASSNLILYTGDEVPQWKGNVLVAALAGKNL